MTQTSVDVMSKAAKSMSLAGINVEKLERTINKTETEYDKANDIIDKYADHATAVENESNTTELDMDEIINNLCSAYRTDEMINNLPDISYPHEHPHPFGLVDLSSITTEGDGDETEAETTETEIDFDRIKKHKGAVNVNMN